MRAFVALPLPDATRGEVGALVRRVAAPGDGVRWVRDENLHLTLAFLGNIDEALVPRIEDRLGRVAARRAPERLVLAGVGGFPAARPRVLWLGLAEGVAWYRRLALEVRAELEALGLEPDRRQPAAHLTLGRGERGARQALERLEVAFAGSSFAWVGEHLTLYSSLLGRAGPTYQEVREWRFAEAVEPLRQVHPGGP